MSTVLKSLLSISVSKGLLRRSSELTTQLNKLPLFSYMKIRQCIHTISHPIKSNRNMLRCEFSTTSPNSALNMQLQKLRMDMEFQSPTFVEETSYSVYPTFIEAGTPTELLALSQLLMNYATSKQSTLSSSSKKPSSSSSTSEKTSIQVIQIYAETCLAFSHLKSEATPNAHSVLLRIIEAFKSIDASLIPEQKFQLTCQLVHLCSCLKEEEKCVPHLTYILGEIKSCLSNFELLDDKQLEEGYQNIFFFIQALADKRDFSQINRFILENDVLNVKWLLKNVAQIPLAILPPPVLLYRIGQIYSENSQRSLAYEYIQLAADIVESIEGSTKGHNYQFLIDELKNLS